MRPLLVAFVLVAAGCVSGERRPSDAVATASHFLDPIAVGNGGDAETSLTVGHDGTMLACTHGGFQQPSPMYASLDGGLTWTRHMPGPNPVPSGDCDVAVLDDGTWVMIYDTIASTTVASSSDQGASWSVNPVAALPVGGVDRPWVLADGNDVLLTYQNVIAAEPAVTMFARSTDGGRTWTDHHLMAGPGSPERPNRVPGHLLRDGDDLRMPVVEFDLNDGETPPAIGFLTSRDEGATWELEIVRDDLSNAFTLASGSRAPDGTLFLTYADGGPDGMDVLAQWSLDGGASWSEPLVIASGLDFDNGVATAWNDARTDGTATVVWHHRTDDGWRLSAARLDPRSPEPIVWSEDATEPVDADRVYEFMMVRHDATGRAHAVVLQAMDGCAEGQGRSLDCVVLVSEDQDSTS